MIKVLSILVIVSQGLLTESSLYHDYCVIGAGPGGLQYSYFLQQAGRNYITFEKGLTPGTFYTKFPIHRYLISINKRNTGGTNKEFNFRHDWNSLISHNEDLQVTKYTKDFFPSADIYVQYLIDYARTLKLNIKFNTTISSLKPRHKIDKLFHLTNQHGDEYKCKTVIVATGIAKPLHINFKGDEYVTQYEDLTTDKKPFEGHSVLILGKGNSAFETGQHLFTHTSSIHFMSRHRLKLAWQTHYVGDLRAVNNLILDTYQLKALDGSYIGDVSKMVVKKNPYDGRLYTLLPRENMTSISGLMPDNTPMREGYDSIISCLGFQFDHSLLNEKIKDKTEKYPKITHEYESQDIEGVYFAGTNTHSLDYRKSAGGFIHGFRYSARTLHRILENKLEGNRWPSTKFDNIFDAMFHLHKRVNEGSDIYQMFSVLCEVMIFNDDDTFTYLEAFPSELAAELSRVSGHKVGSKGVLFATLEYGKNFSGVGVDTFYIGRATLQPSNAHDTNFLHVVLYYYKTLPSKEMMSSRLPKWTLPIPDFLHHFISDASTIFDAPNIHRTPFRRFLERILQKDLKQYLADQCMTAALTYATMPESCKILDTIKNDGLLCGRECSATLKRMKTSLLHKFSAFY